MNRWKDWMSGEDETFAPSHLPKATSELEAGQCSGCPDRAKQACIRICMYLDLDQCHTFTPVAIETASPFGPESLSFLRELYRLPPHDQEGEWS